MTTAAPNRTYEIHEVAELTGLAPARLRAWERRYEVVRPSRQPTAIAPTPRAGGAAPRLWRLIAGERIGDLVARPREEVLTKAEARALDGSPQAALLEAVRTFDRERLEGLVAQQLSLRGLRAFAEEVVLPLAQSVGDLWALGKIPIAAEHLASEVVLHALKGGLRMSRGTGPLVVCGCLSGERHEWGFLATLAVLQEDGWRIHYLGADLPVEEVIEAAWQLSPVRAFSSSDRRSSRQPPRAAVTGCRRTIAAIGGRGVRPPACPHGLRIGSRRYRALR
jgi:hypothetical protein